MPSDALITGPLRAPLNLAESGSHGNERLSPQKIKTTPDDQWTGKFFEPLTTPDRTFAMVKRQAFEPVTFS